MGINRFLVYVELAHRHSVLRQLHTKCLGLSVTFRTNGDFLDNAAAGRKVALPLCSHASLRICDQGGEYQACWFIYLFSGGKARGSWKIFAATAEEVDALDILGVPLRDSGHI